MAKIHLDRLKKKYGKTITSKNYQEIINLIIEQNTKNIQNKITRMSSEQWSKSLKKITPKEKKFVLPDTNEVLPKRAVHTRKSAERGKLLTDSLRDKLTKNLRSVMTDYTTKTGEPTFVRRRGALAGRINPKLIKVFEKQTQKVFQNYNRRDKTLGMPKNLHGIAVTEVRSSINEIKGQYAQRLAEKNPEVIIKKKWIQNLSLSKNPRKGHRQVNGKVIGKDELFKVPRYVKVLGKYIRVGVTLMRHPHDPNAPADQVINCNCDFDIIISRERKK